MSKLIDDLFNQFLMNDGIENDNYIIEGIIVDPTRKSVRLTDETSQGVDFSNREYLEYKFRSPIGTIDVISIFGRTRMIDVRKREVDGNPFIYALKNDNKDPIEKTKDWHFEISDSEIIKYVRRFLDVCNTISDNYDTIIMVPSTHKINKRFMDVIYDKVSATNKVEDFFYKTEKQEAYDSRNLKKIYKYAIKRANGDPIKAEKIENDIILDIDKCFDRMTGKYFQAAKLTKEYLQFIDLIVTPNHKYTPEIASRLITGKRILVLDDILSTGFSVSSCVKNILQYEPAKVQVITLLSDKDRGRIKSKPLSKKR